MQAALGVALLAPIVGAVVAYFLNGGSRLRRARLAAIEDLSLHEKAKVLLGEESPLVDQVETQARVSVRQYLARRAAHAGRAAAWFGLATIAVISILLAAVTVALDITSIRATVAIGVLGGAVGVAAEATFQRRSIHLALRRLLHQTS